MKVYIIDVLEEALNGTPIPFEKHILPNLTEANKTFEKIRKKAMKERFEELGRRKAIGGPWEMYKESVPYDGHGVYTFLRRIDCTYLYVVCKTGELSEDPEVQ